MNHLTFERDREGQGRGVGVSLPGPVWIFFNPLMH